MVGALGSRHLWSLMYLGTTNQTLKPGVTIWRPMSWFLWGTCIHWSSPIAYSLWKEAGINWKIQQISFYWKLSRLKLCHSIFIPSFHSCDISYWLIVFNLQGQLPNSYLLRDIFEDLIGSLLETSSEENVFNSQPCRDNILYLLNLCHELFVDQIGIKLLVWLSNSL